MDAIVPITDLTNRSQRRKFEKEALSIIEDLEKVNTEFLYHLFDDNDKSSYKELYSKFNGRWHKTITDILKSRKINNLAIDKLWFNNNYKPLME